MRAISLTALVLFMTAGCCSLKDREDMRERAEKAERERDQALMFLAGKDEDNAMLQRYGIELQQELRRWQFGSMLQAHREAELRRSCDI